MAGASVGRIVPEIEPCWISAEASRVIRAVSGALALLISINAR
jgi:hypothetical protein